MEFRKLQEIIRAEVASQNHLTNIRNHNHAAMEELNKSYPIADKTLLDLGASVHGYALEAAVIKGVRRYEGIDLGIERHWKSPRVEFVGDAGTVGQLTQMNANRLEFPSGTFDCILSISTFEHFLDPAGVLAEMHRVLRPGAVALVSFEPIWTSSRGHHLHHFGAISRLVPDWGHLFLDEAQMQRVLARQSWPHDSPLTMEQALRWIYQDDGVNRLDIRKLKEVFRHSPFDIVWMCDLADEEEAGRKRAIAEYLTRIVSFNSDELMTKGLSLLLRK
jgi:ubiquinone/menaquinone biosynthesis C-methylase UbiE